MAKIVQDFWIISENGIVLYHRKFSDDIDEQLFGGLLTALQSFAEELLNEGITSFEIQGTRFSIKKKNRILFIADSAKATKEKKVMNELDTISRKFFETYPHDIVERWDGDTTPFKYFGEQIEDSLQNTIQKFQEAFW